MNLPTSVVLGISICFLSLLFVESFAPEFRGDSRFFLDTADEREWEELLCTGMFHGVTTNPTLLQQADQPCTVDNLHRMAFTALKSVDEFMCQTWGSTVEELYERGMALSAPARDRIVVKVPVTFLGVQAASKLIQAGCRVCLTACFDHKQALVAVSIGAEYIAPYLGRMNDAGKNGMKECSDMMEIVHGMQGETRILVASLRNVEMISQLALSELDTFTMSPKVARELLCVEPLTDKVAAAFEKAAAHVVLGNNNDMDGEAANNHHNNSHS